MSPNDSNDPRENPPPILSINNGTAALFVDGFLDQWLCKYGRSSFASDVRRGLGSDQNWTKLFFGKGQVSKTPAELFKERLLRAKDEASLTMIDTLAGYYKNKKKRIEIASQYFDKEISADAFITKKQPRKSAKRPRLCIMDKSIEKTDDFYALFEGFFGDFSSSQIAYKVNPLDEKVSLACRQVCDGTENKVQLVSTKQVWTFYYGDICVYSQINTPLRQVKDNVSWGDLNFQSGDIIRAVLPTQTG